MNDSRIDTYQHIQLVQSNLALVLINLQARLVTHDRSKLFSPEKEVYDDLSHLLKEHPYGSDGYKDVLRAADPAIQHHYSKNRHHPEFWERGIQDMDLLDLIEMLCDWHAANRRHGGDFIASLDHSQERFGFSDDVKEIFENTARFLDEKISRINSRIKK